MSGDRFRITYRILRETGESTTDKVRAIAYEQTVELPEDCVSPEIRDRIVGEVETIEELGGSHARAVISYPAQAVGDEIPQFLNLLFGNISMKSGIRVTGIDWPVDWLDRFPGPRYGIDGLRELCSVGERRPLLCAALKPMGLDASGLARICAELALGGVDIVKDDHGLADQPSAPFDERVRHCREAVERANASTGGTTLYFPNVTCRATELPARLASASAAGCRGILISPLLMGPDTVRGVAESSGLALLAHPALSGAFFHEEHGIAPEILLGQIFRIIGGDGVIYPNAGGRFPFSEESCRAINDRLRGPLGSLRPAFPVPGGGIDARRVPHWIDRYGADIIFLIGGSLYAQPDLARATGRLSDAIRRAAR